MSDNKTKSVLRQELEVIVEKLNALPSMAKNFGGGLLGDVVKFIGKLVNKSDALEARLAELEKKTGG